MKIRNGFVSNSSSSSFIMIGVSSSVLKKPFDKNTGLEELYVERKNCDYIIGNVLSDDEYLEDGDLSVDTMIEWSDKISKLLDVPASEVKLYYGIRPA